MNKFKSSQVFVRIISGDSKYVEEEICRWLSADSREVVNLLQSGEANSVTISIWYRI
jgi:hypothetical protein